MVNRTVGGAAIEAITGKESLPEKSLREKVECEAKGGTWNEETQTCTLPFQPPERTTLTPEEARQAPGFVGEEPGIPVGGKEVGFAGARENVVVPEREQRALAAQGKAQTAEQETEFRRIQDLKALAKRIGIVGELTEAEEADINISQAVTAGSIGALPSVLSTAGTFAVGGAVAGGPVGAAIGAGVGIIAAIAAGVSSNIKEQQAGELQAADIELSAARTNMRQLAMLATQDPANADIYIAQYNDQLTRVHQARRQTAAEVKGDLNAYIEDGREQLADFDAFLRPGGIADVYGQKLNIALQSGTPLSINGDELI